jgi:4-amino-4-deoxy-L-arabinose transferase-like glycosyltransferase
VPFPGILLLALAVRLVAVGASFAVPRALALREYHTPAQPCTTVREWVQRRPSCATLAEDELAYDALGRSIAAGHGYVLEYPWVFNTANEPTAYGNFLYPAFVGSVYALSGGSALALMVLQSLFGALAVVGLSVAARDLAGQRAGLVVGLVAALHPGLVLSSVLVLTEALEVPILVALFLAWIRFVRGPSGRGAALVGALAAAACLTRSPALYAVPVMCVATLAGRDARAALRPRLLLGAAAVAVLLMLPWTVRNAVRFGAFVPADTKAGAALWLFNHPSPSLVREVWTGLPNAVPPPGPVAGLNEAQVDMHFRGLAMRYIAGAPVAFAEASLLRFGMFLVPFPRNWHLPWLKAAGSLLYAGVTWLGIAGLWRARRTLEGRALLGLGITWIALLAATSTGLRFRLSVEWVLAFGAGLALAELWTRMSSPQRAAADPAAGAARVA